MSEWVKAREAAKRQYGAMKKLVAGYGYGERKEAEKTDMEVRKLAAKGVHDSRDELFPMIEAAYLSKDFGSAGALDEVMKWFDLYLLEMELMIILKDGAGFRGYATLVKADLELIKGTEKLPAAVRKMNADAAKGNAAAAVKKGCGEIKQSIMELMQVLKKRRHALGG